MLITYIKVKQQHTCDSEQSTIDTFIRKLKTNETVVFQA